MTQCTCTDLERGVENCRCRKPKELKATAKKKSKKLYANMLNLSGLYSNKPVMLTFDSESDRWWDKDGNFEATKVGTESACGYVKFTSESRREVECWTNGVLASMERLVEWCIGGELA
jgi:hypothetical protein